MSDDTHLNALRAEIRGWLADNAPKGWREAYKGMSHEEFAQAQRDWFATLVKGGYAVPHWPAEWPGGGRTLAEQKVIYEEMARADTPRLLLSFVSTYHAASTLFECGTDEQKARYLPAILEGETWCQGFSEPNAGSDLAALKTRAERNGDVYVINGQKVWSSYGAFADYCLLLARTDPNAPKKQAGISYFILNMKAPGVTVRPIRQATGQAEFCEIFLDKVEIPVADLIGEENGGWAIAQSTLSAERGLIIFELSERMARTLDADLAEAKRTNAAWLKDDEARRAFTRAYSDMVALRLMIRALMQEIEIDPHMGSTSMPTYIKVHFSELLRRYTEFRLRLGGLSGQVRRPIVLGGGHQTGNAMHDFLLSYAWTISGGANEILKTVIAERSLGLPR